MYSYVPLIILNNFFVISNTDARRRAARVEARRRLGLECMNERAANMGIADNDISSESDTESNNSINYASIVVSEDDVSLQSIEENADHDDFDIDDEIRDGGSGESENASFVEDNDENMEINQIDIENDNLVIKHRGINEYVLRNLKE